MTSTSATWSSSPASASSSSSMAAPALPSACSCTASPCSCSCSCTACACPSRRLRRDSLKSATSVSTALSTPSGSASPCPSASSSSPYGLYRILPRPLTLPRSGPGIVSRKSLTLSFGSPCRSFFACRTLALADLAGAGARPPCHRNALFLRFSGLTSKLDANLANTLHRCHREVRQEGRREVEALFVEVTPAPPTQVVLLGHRIGLEHHLSGLPPGHGRKLLRIHCSLSLLNWATHGVESSAGSVDIGENNIA
mmetsp:Transcript_34514/g.80691  ORF Transcript_34514/g.80691 Transcript_34514/m.80691 type:complete len:254 (-) Transcript_34514:731-1492(-)